MYEFNSYHISSCVLLADMKPHPSIEHTGGKLNMCFYRERSNLTALFIATRKTNFGSTHDCCYCQCCLSEKCQPGQCGHDHYLESQDSQASTGMDLEVPCFLPGWRSGCASHTAHVSIQPRLKLTIFFYFYRILGFRSMKNGYKR